MGRQTGKWGQLVMPISDGVKSTNVELTKAATKTIQGVIYADQFYGHAQTHWNQAMNNIFMPQGIVGDFDVSPVPSVNDTVSVTALQYHKDATGVQTAAGARLTLTRDATKKQIHTVHVVAATGSFGVTTGVASVASIFSSTYGGDAGPSLLSIGDLGVININLTPGSAGPVAGADITPLLPDGTFIQERADMPSGEIIELLGGVLFQSALLPCHTGGIPRKVFATFTSQKSVLQALADVTKGSLQETGAVVKMPAMGDLAGRAAPSGTIEWSGSLEKYAVNTDVSKRVTNKRVGYLRIYRDKNVNEYREGAVVYTTHSENIDQAAAIMETVAFTGSGPLEWNV